MMNCELCIIFSLIQITSFGEIKSLKEELSKKSSLLVKLKEDKMKKPSGLDTSPSRTSGDKEKDELRKTIRRLEERLSAVNRAEKPLEDGSQPGDDSTEKQVCSNYN